MDDVKVEKATYDPDLPHDYLPALGSCECALCGRPRREDLHQLDLPERQRASSELLQRELGS